MVYIDRILYPIETLGPGKRMVVWVKGCGRKCPGCANPELWERGDKGIPEKTLIAVLNKVVQEQGPDGITVTGGEPFDQAEELSLVLDSLEGFDGNVLIYSGYLYEELKSDPYRAQLLKCADVLIDGAYIDEQNDGRVPLRGSLNQRVIYLNDDVKSLYEEYMKQGRKIRNVFFGSSLISVGIHNRRE